MEELINRIETYNIINYLFPGVIFATIFNYLMESNIYDSNLAIAIVEYYFTGLVLSRIGSVLIKPILEKTKIIQKKDYKKFIEKEKDDEKLSLLQREGNQYRTFIATFISLAIIEIYNVIIGNRDKAMSVIVFVALSVLFILSYKKQTKFIVDRIEA